MANDRDIITDWNEAYNIAILSWGLWLEEAKKDLGSYLGPEQWDNKDSAYLKAQRRTVLTFNKIRRVVHLLSGYERKNRLALVINPVEGSDDHTAAQFTSLLLHIMQGDGYMCVSDAFDKGPVKTGLNLIEPYIDYSYDYISGDIKFKRIPFNRALLDPRFAERNLSDVGFMLRREYLTKDGVISLLPTKEAEIKEIGPKGLDNKFIIGRPYKLGINEDVYTYDEFWTMGSEKVVVIADPTTGVHMEWPGKDDARLKLFLHDFPNIKKVVRYKKVSRLHIIVNNKHIWEGPDPMGLDELRFIPSLGFYDPEYTEMRYKLQGIVRCMRDPQTEINKRRSKVLDIIDSLIQTGWKAKETKVANPQALYGSGQGRVVWMKEDADMTDAERLTPVDVPQGFFRLMEVLDKDINDIPGANAELFGMPEKEQKQVAALLAKMRSNAGLTVLQDLYDNHRYTKKQLGNKLVKIIQKNFLPVKVRRILNEEPTKEFYNSDFGRYDCVPEEGLLTDTQKQMHFAQLLQLMEMGAPIPWSAILESAPLHNRRKLMEIMQQEEEKQSALMNAEREEEQIARDLMKARTASDIAAAEEKRAQALENRTSAAFDRVKMMKELQKIDDDRVLDVLKFIHDLESEKAVKGKQPKVTKR